MTASLVFFTPTLHTTTTNTFHQHFTQQSADYQALALAPKTQ